MSLDKNDPQLTAYVLDELDATQRATGGFGHTG